MQPPHVLDYIRANYHREGCALISKRFNMSSSLVKHYAAKWGLVVDEDAKREHRPFRAAQMNKQPFDYKVNPTHFANVTTPEVAYLLGLLWADGNLYTHSNPNKLKTRITLSLIASDMESIRQTLAATGQWNWHSVQRPNRQLQFLARTSNKPLFDILDALDYRSKSASPDKVLATIPDHLKHYWFRGLVDGDGCITSTTNRRVSIASAYDQDWTYMERLCGQLQIASCRIVRTVLPTSRSSCFEISRIDDMLAFCRYIYQGHEQDKMGLPRKRQKYEELLSLKIGEPNKPIRYLLKEVIYDRSNKAAHTRQIVRLLPSLYVKSVLLVSETEQAYNRLSRGEKISLKRSRSVTCTTNGKVYKSAQHAADDVGIHRHSVDKVLKGERPNVKGWVFIYTQPTVVSA